MAKSEIGEPKLNDQDPPKSNHFLFVSGSVRNWGTTTLIWKANIDIQFVAESSL